jgi:hypothetical protein
MQITPRRRVSSTSKFFPISFLGPTATALELRLMIILSMGLNNC